MTPKEKAKELVEKFEDFADYHDCDVFTQIERLKINAKQCALLAVNEMIEQVKKFKFMIHYEYEIMYLNTVKQEIEKL